MADHKSSFAALASEAAKLKPVLINSHSGHDSWGSGADALAFFQHALQVEAGLSLPIVHETHRQRLLYSPYSASAPSAASANARLPPRAALKQRV